MNISKSAVFEESLAELFRLLAQPARLQILLVIGTEEACVCHLEAALGLRQAYISQQLMILRDAGLVTANRDGRNIYYRLSNPAVLNVILQAAEALGVISPGQITQPGLIEGCPCPHCAETAGNAQKDTGDASCNCKTSGTKK